MQIVKNLSMRRSLCRCSFGELLTPFGFIVLRYFGVSLLCRSFGSSFGSLSFGNVASPVLTEDFLASDLTVIGSLAGGGGLGNVDLIYVPEPSAICLLLIGILCCSRCRVSRTTGD